MSYHNVTASELYFQISQYFTIFSPKKTLELVFKLKFPKTVPHIQS